MKGSSVQDIRVSQKHSHKSKVQRNWTSLWWFVHWTLGTRVILMYVTKTELQNKDYELYEKMDGSMLKSIKNELIVLKSSINHSLSQNNL